MSCDSLSLHLLQDFSIADSKAFRDLLSFQAQSGHDKAPHHKDKDVPHRVKITERVISRAHAATTSLKDALAVRKVLHYLIILVTNTYCLDLGGSRPYPFHVRCLDLRDNARVSRNYVSFCR